MKAITCILGIGVVLGVIIYITEIDKSPRIIFPGKTHYEFGVVNEGETVRREFPFRNDGRSALVISKVRSSCSCTKGDVTQKTVPPGGTSAVVLEYTGRNVFNREEASVFLETNDPKSKYVSVSLAGLVRVRVFWMPQSVSFYSLSSVPRESKSISLLSSFGELQVKRIETSSDLIRASWNRDGKRIKINVALDPNFPQGNQRENVLATIELDGKERQVDIPIFVMLGRTS
jgi:hypothetical protein